jgi:hypothetical protein
MAYDNRIFRGSRDAIGAPGDPPAVAAADDNTMVSLLKGLYSLLDGTISVSTPAGMATSAKQDDEIAALASILAKITSDPATQTTLAAVLAKLNAGVGVTGTFWQATQPVSLTSVPSHAVTNAGTFAVQQTSAAGTLVATTVASGGTAANVFGATPANGFEVVNPHVSETLYIRENGTATVADNSTSIPIAPKGSYTTPPGYKPTGDVSYIAATTGHAIIARRW